ncbi:hypothetical protein ACJX0J_038185, partial [Zea mays]
LDQRLVVDGRPQGLTFVLYFLRKNQNNSSTFCDSIEEHMYMLRKARNTFISLRGAHFLYNHIWSWSRPLQLTQVMF